MEPRTQDAAYQRLLETFLEQPLTAYYVIEDSRLSFVSPGFEAFFGYTKAELIGRDPFDLIAPDDRELVRARIAQRLAGQASHVRYVFRVRHKQGHDIAVEGFARAAELDGRPATVGVLIDVTEKMDYQRRLEEREHQMRQVFDQSPVALFVTRLKDHRILYVNGRAAELVQAPRQAVVGREGADFWQCPADRERVVQAVIRDGCARDLEMGFKRGTGEGLTVVIAASPMVFDGEQAIIIGVNDISARKRAEDAVRDSERKLRLLTDNKTDVVWAVGADMRYTYISPSIERTLGAAPEDFLGHDIRDGLTPESAAKARRLIDEACATAAREARNGPPSKAELRMELQHPHVDGGVADSEVCATLVFDADGCLTNMYGVTRDIGERKRLQAALQRRATIDDLTGLENRSEFLARLAAEMDRARRHGCALTVGMLDLDRFKSINDTHGHAAGDVALRRFAEISRAVGRATDVIGRVGGEEFAMFLPETGVDEAMRVAERLRLAVAMMAVQADGPAFAVTVSIGLAEAWTEDTPAQALSRADHALYRAKKSGRNRVMTWLGIGERHMVDGEAVRTAQPTESYRPDPPPNALNVISV